MLDRLRGLFRTPAYEYARVVRKELCRLRVLVALELPELARGEDGYYSRPIRGLEACGGVDEDEGQRL